MLNDTDIHVFSLSLFTTERLHMLLLFLASTPATNNDHFPPATNGQTFEVTLVLSARYNIIKEKSR